MTSHELARKLLEMEDLMVTVRGYEGGADELKIIEKPRELHLHVRDSNDWGEHAYTHWECEDGNCNHEVIRAIHLMKERER